MTGAGRLVSAGVLVLSVVFVFLLRPGPVGAAIFTQCPPIGADTGCGILITLPPSGPFTVTDATAPAQPPYDNIEDTLIGVQNNSGQTVTSIHLSSLTTQIFGFDGDGICGGGFSFTGSNNCPSGAGTTGYEGPGTSFANINQSTLMAGDVRFTNGLADGASAFFSLEDQLTAVALIPGPVAAVPEPATLLLLGSTFAGVGVLRRRLGKRNS